MKSYYCGHCFEYNGEYYNPKSAYFDYWVKNCKWNSFEFSKISTSFQSMVTTVAFAHFCEKQNLVVYDHYGTPRLGDREFHRGNSVEFKTLPMKVKYKVASSHLREFFRVVDCYDYNPQTASTNMYWPMRWWWSKEAADYYMNNGRQEPETHLHDDDWDAVQDALCGIRDRWIA